MNASIIPSLTNEEKREFLRLANESIRSRAPKIQHDKGDYLNKVFNFILSDSYMHPHLHPGEEKIEKMYLIEGSFALILFDDDGRVTETIVLKKSGREQINVPAFTWHTYVMLTDEVIVYETMEGVYHPDTWKKLAVWAPAENTLEAVEYLSFLKSQVTRLKSQVTR